MRQKELIDLSREYENLLQKFPSRIICSVLGFKSIPITVVTSTRTKEAMRTGVDDDDTVFKK